MTKAEKLDFYYRTIDWKELYYEVEAMMVSRRFREEKNNGDN